MTLQSDGRRGQFEVSVDGKIVVARKGGLLAKVMGKPWPESSDVVAAVGKALGR